MPRRGDDDVDITAQLQSSVDVGKPANYLAKLEKLPSIVDRLHTDRICAIAALASSQLSLSFCRPTTRRTTRITIRVYSNPYRSTDLDLDLQVYDLDPRVYDFDFQSSASYCHELSTRMQKIEEWKQTDGRTDMTEFIMFLANAIGHYLGLVCLVQLWLWLGLMLIFV